MFTTVLPYSKDRFKIKKLTFSEIFDISKLLYEDDINGFISYIEDFFGIANYNVIDKFYILLKARELYSDNTISLTAGSNNINLYIKTLLEKLNDLPDFRHTYTDDILTIILDVPTVFITPTDIAYDSVIKEIQFDDIIIKFSELSSEDKNVILTSLSPKYFKVIKTFIDTTNLQFELYEGKKSLDIGKIEINFFQYDPILLIKSLYSEYSLHSCREIMFYLSKRISDSILLKSTMSDIKYYLDELSKEKKQSNNSGNIDQLL